MAKLLLVLIHILLATVIWILLAFLHWSLNELDRMMGPEWAEPALMGLGMAVVLAGIVALIAKSSRSTISAAISMATIGVIIASVPIITTTWMRLWLLPIASICLAGMLIDTQTKTTETPSEESV